MIVELSHLGHSADEDFVWVFGVEIWCHGFIAFLTGVGTGL